MTIAKIDASQGLAKLRSQNFFCLARLRYRMQLVMHTCSCEYTCPRRLVSFSTGYKLFTDDTCAFRLFQVPHARGRLSLDHFELNRTHSSVHDLADSLARTRHGGRRRRSPLTDMCRFDIFSGGDSSERSPRYRGHETVLQLPARVISTFDPRIHCSLLWLHFPARLISEPAQK